MMEALVSEVGVADAQNAAREARVPMGGDDAEPIRGMDGMALEEGGVGRYVTAAEQGAVGGSGDDELGGGRKGGRAALKSGGGSKELLEKEANLGTVGLDADDT